MNRDLMPLVADIVSSHASSNAVSREGLAQAIKSVYATLKSLAAETRGTSDPDDLQSNMRVPEHAPAVPIERSVFPDYIICLEDGKKLKMLKRHLQASYSMTLEEYRGRWGLPHNYPMTAPNYAERRSALAKASGLGLKHMPVPPVKRVKEGVRGRPRKTMPSI
jgi:predicted transcriptional regulator